MRTRFSLLDIRARAWEDELFIKCQGIYTRRYGFVPFPGPNISGPMGSLHFSKRHIMSNEDFRPELFAPAVGNIFETLAISEN